MSILSPFSLQRKCNEKKRFFFLNHFLYGTPSLCLQPLDIPVHTQVKIMRLLGGKVSLVYPNDSRHNSSKKIRKTHVQLHIIKADVLKTKMMVPIVDFIF